jgi:hypothetical protein
VKRGKVLSHWGRSTVTQKAVPRAEERTATTKRTSRGGRGGEKYSFCESGKEEESSFDLEKRTNLMIRPQRSMGYGYARRRECTTFCKHKVVENNYGCLQNVVRSSERQNVRTSERRQNVTTAGTGNQPGTPTKAYFRHSAWDVKLGKVLSHQGRSTATQKAVPGQRSGQRRRGEPRGEEEEEKNTLPATQEKRRKVPLTWRSGQI